MSTLVYWAFFSGGIAAFSLTLGSLVGLTLKIPSYIIGILAAFGAGALLSALAIELGEILKITNTKMVNWDVQVLEHLL